MTADSGLPGRLWFAVPKDRIAAEPRDRGGSDLAAITSDEVWVVSHVLVDGEWWLDNVARELPGLLGSSVECAASFAVEAGADLPPDLHTWGTARNVPAQAIGPGTPTLMTIDGMVRLAAYWDFDAVRATVTVTESGTVWTLAPADVTPVRLHTVPDHWRR